MALERLCQWCTQPFTAGVPQQRNCTRPACRRHRFNVSLRKCRAAAEIAGRCKTCTSATRPLKPNTAFCFVCLAAAAQRVRVAAKTWDDVACRYVPARAA